jgi:hypothetical protein
MALAIILKSMDFDTGAADVAAFVVALVILLKSPGFGASLRPRPNVSLIYRGF